MLVVTVMAVARWLNIIKAVEIAHIGYGALVGLRHPRKVWLIISGGSYPFFRR